MSLFQQVLATNDCLLRARGQATYVATVDLDEVFVIRTNLSMLQTIDSLFGNAPDAGAVIFRSAYATFDVSSGYVVMLEIFFFYYYRDISSL